MDHIERRHSIVLAGPIDRVFPLFTPAGEKLWVEGWDPEYLHPVNGETCEGMVFRTGHGEETTLWGCVAWNPVARRVRYARVTPTSRFGFVEVACREVAGDRTEATIAYTFTALSPRGQSDLADLTQKGFASMIEGWRTAIDGWLSRNVA